MPNSDRFSSLHSRVSEVMRLKALQCCRSTYSEEQRANWSTLIRLQYAFTNAASSSNFLAKHQESSGVAIETLLSQVADQVELIEVMVAEIDLERLKTDAEYAGSLLDVSQVAREIGDAACTLTEAITQLLSAQQESVAAQLAYDQLTDPSSPKQKFAVVKEAFRHRDGDGNPTSFHKGQHCLLDYSIATGTVLRMGNWAVFINNELFAQYFSIVEK